MAKRKRSPQVWIIKYRLGKKREHLQSPMMKYPWEVLLWLKKIKPMAEVESIEPFRRLSVPK